MKSRVCRKGAAERFIAHVTQRAALDHAGIVDEDIEPLPDLRNMIGELAALHSVRDVDRHDEVGLAASQKRKSALQGVLSATAKGGHHAAFCRFHCQGATDARPCSGDQYPFRLTRHP
jgi:hypothetical protein